MVRESVWAKTKAYIRRMRGNRAGGCIAILLLFLLDAQCVTSTTPMTTNQLIQYRLPTHVVPMSYDIKVTPFVDEGNYTFNGETKIFITVLNETTNITLHAHHELEVDQHATSIADAQGKLMKPKYHYRDSNTDFLTLNFERSLKPGKYLLSFHFSGNISSEPVGIYKSSYVNAKEPKTWLVSTQFLPAKARRAFPCWDEPALKATFNISINHFPNYTATSNMPVKNSIDAANGRKWTIFNTTPVMSTYAVAFVISDFKCISNTDKSINTCIQKQALPITEYLQEVNEKALPLLVEYTGMPYSLPKLDSYAIPEADSGGVDNWGLITYRASTLIFDNTSYSAKESAIEIFLHQLAHQWFGNLVTPAWWSDLWIKEGLSRYMQFYIGDEIFPEWGWMDTLVTRVLQTMSFSLESPTSSRNLNQVLESPGEINSYSSFFANQKGPCIIHMLGHIIGEQYLREGIRIYLRKHQYGTATTDDFWHAMQEVYGHGGDINIKNVMDPWIEQRGYPIVKVTRNYEAGIAILTQSPSSLNDMTSRWYLPINFASESKTSYTHTRPTLWLKPNEANATIANLNKEEWLLVNLKQSGYYRVDYDEHNWLQLAKYLNTEKFANIHVVNRAQIINDLFYMVVLERQNLTTFLEVTKYLAREVDYIPWRRTFSSFTALRGKIQDKTFFDNLKKYALHLMEKIIIKMGFSESPTDSYMMRRWRSEILTGACYYGHMECRKIAGEKLIEFLQNPSENPLPPNLEEWILNSAVYNKKAEILLQEKIESGAYEYMGHINLAQNFTFYIKFIKEALRNSTIPKNVTLIALRGLGNCDDEIWDDVVDFYINNFGRLHQYFNNTETLTSILRDYILGAPSAEHMEKIIKFVKNANPQVASLMENVILQQTEKLKWSKINAPIFNNWLENELANTAPTA